MSRFFDGLKNLLSTLPNTRNATASNQIVSTWLDPSTLRHIYKTGLGNKIIRVKSGYALKNDMYFSDEQDKAFYNKKLAKHVKLATTFMLAFGRGIILINESGKDLSLPMTGKPDVYKLDVFSGDMVTAQGASIDLSDKRYMKPKYYNVRGANFHHSRVIDFKHVAPPELESPQYQYGGISEFELIHSQLINDGVVERASATIIDKNSSFFYKIKGFKEILSSGKEADILKFYQMTENARSIFGAGLIDSEDDVMSVSQTLTDLDKVDQITLRRLAMVTGIPLAILVGENVKGLNSTGKNEKQAFNEMIDMLQRDYIFDPLNDLLSKLGKGEVDFLENQNVTALEKIEFETKALDNALKLQTLGEDYGAYLSNLGITEKDNFEEMFGEIGNGTPLSDSIIADFEETKIKRNEEGEFASKGASKGASAPQPAKKKEVKVDPKAKSLSTDTPKQFSTALTSEYKKQGVEDWQSDYLSSLPLKGYFGTSQAFEVNQGLRDGKKMSPRAKDAAKAVEAGFEKHAIKLPQGTVLHRAVGGKFAEQLQNMKEGDSFVDKGYMSTAGVKSTTERFGKVRMEITPSPGTKGLVYRDESEVLLQPGKKVTIGNKRKEGDVTIISVTVS